MYQELWEIHPPLEGETAAAYHARLAVIACATAYIRETNTLAGNGQAARETGIVAVFDGNAAHAMSVMDARTAANPLHTRAVQILQDVLERKQIKLHTGSDPGSPVPAGKLVLAPSSPEQYVADEAIIDAALDRMLAQTYTVYDVAP